MWIIGLLRTHTQIIWEPLIVSCRMTPSRSQSDHLYTVEFPLEVYEQIARDVDDIDTYYTFLDTTQTLKDKIYYLSDIYTRETPCIWETAS